MRKHLAGYSRTASCLLCGHQQADDAHQMYGCAPLKDLAIVIEGIDGPFTLEHH